MILQRSGHSLDGPYPPLMRRSLKIQIVPSKLVPPCTPKLAAIFLEAQDSVYRVAHDVYQSSSPSLGSKPASSMVGSGCSCRSAHDGSGLESSCKDEMLARRLTHNCSGRYHERPSCT
ncbi:hypothetical protein VNO77_19018 [Canavalia gladiata]|uniref:Uncharacterized protein n=1 Tax=Canavalia gladiata TaxID=3824 RepID=A0AAN9LML5_CANGL